MTILLESLSYTGKVNSSLQERILKNLHLLLQVKNFQNLAASGQEVFERLERFS